MTTDLTKGSPAKLIFMFTIPYLIGNLFQQFYNIADTVIVGRILGMNALAAVGATGSIVWFAMGTIQGFTTGFSAVTAQRFGAGDIKGLKKSFAMGIVWSVVITAILTFFCIKFARPVLEIMNTPAEIFEDSYKYIMWIFIGLFATTLFNLLSNIIRALGDAKTPLIFLVVACLINIVLDYVLIIYTDMGPAGAGCATFIAQLVSGLLCVVYLIKKFTILHLSKEDCKFDRNMSGQLLLIGMPMAFLNMVLAIGGVIIQFVNNGLGTLYVASYAAANKVEQFITQPMISFGSATAVYAAQNYGAGKYKRIKTGANKSIIMTLVWSVVSSVLMLFLGKFIMSAVAGNESAELINNGYNYLVINSVLSVILAPLVIYKCVLQSVGRAIIPTISGFIEVFCRAGASLWLSQMFGFIGVCFANPAAWLGALIIIAFDYWLLMRKFKSQGMNEQTID